MTKKDKVAINAFKEYVPKGEEAPRYQYNWDMMLDESNWMAIDFHESRKWERAMAYKIAREAKSKAVQVSQQRTVKKIHEKVVSVKLASMVEQVFFNIQNNRRVEIKPAIQSYII